MIDRSYNDNLEVTSTYAAEAISTDVLSLKVLSSPPKIVVLKSSGTASGWAASRSVILIS